jgi:hypothetical protein
MSSRPRGGTLTGRSKPLGTAAGATRAPARYHFDPFDESRLSRPNCWSYARDPHHIHGAWLGVHRGASAAAGVGILGGRTNDRRLVCMHHHRLRVGSASGSTRPAGKKGSAGDDSQCHARDRSGATSQAGQIACDAGHGRQAFSLERSPDAAPGPVWFAGFGLAPGAGG